MSHGWNITVETFSPKLCMLLQIESADPVFLEKELFLVPY